MVKLTAWQAECETTSGHCWHSFKDAAREVEVCCACNLRRNEKVFAEQKELL